jgi:hypothetical protein
LSAEDWPALRQIFVEFSTGQSLSFRSDEKLQGGNIMWRNLSLCDEAGITIEAADQPWLAHTNSPLADRGVRLSVYELKAGSGWNPIARDLLGEVETRWPTKTTFRGPDGKAVSMEDALRGRQ